MSDSTVSNSSVAEIIANNFLLAWKAGSLLFTEMKNSKNLRETFEAAVKLCKSDIYLVQMTMNANRIIMERIIERNNSDYKASEELKSLGTDIAELIKFLHTKQ
jgi:DNA-binding ferritin-like protein (Dps family)